MIKRKSITRKTIAIFSIISLIIMIIAFNVLMINNNRKNKAIILTSNDTITALGDSSITGYNCTCNNFITDYAKINKINKYYNYGLNGGRTTDVIQQLNKIDVRNNISKSKGVIIMIGANDLASIKNNYENKHINNIYYNETEIYNNTINNIKKIVNTIISIRGKNKTIINLVVYWNLFQDGSMAIKNNNEYNWSKTLTEKFNHDISVIAKNNHANFIDTDKIFVLSGHNRDYFISPDGEHLNNNGNTLLARKIPMKIIE